MKVSNRFALTSLALCLLCLSPVQADDRDGQWQHSVDVYLWGAAVGGTTNSGTDIDVSFGDLLDTLEFAAMGAYQARKGKWAIMADVIYLDVADTTGFELGGNFVNVPVEVDTELTSWVVHLGGSYNFYEGENGSMAGVTFGARYLDLATDILITFDSPLPDREPQIPINVSEGVLDAFVGLRGVAVLGERWYLPWAGNIGTGDSDISWAALAGVGYRASERWNVVLNYRYHAWEFDDTVVIEDLDFSGPMLGAVFHF